MSELVQREFPASALMFGLRSIGYNFSTAVADILDNSISAEATKICVFSDPLAKEPYFCIFDNGHGMSRQELDNAMLPGSDRKTVQDSELELGRFGLGLKSASLSQCREFTVVSKRYGRTNAMSFDLDVIEEYDKLMIKCLGDSEMQQLPCFEEIEKVKTGTLVIWRKFDKIPIQCFEDSFRSMVGEAKKHVELVFHRFYNQVEIYFNNKRIEKRDPFLLNSVGRQQTGRTTTIAAKNGAEIVVTPYTLPFANTLTQEEKELLGNPKSIFDDQGFYCYRNKRLISWGGWMHMCARSEMNKLARIQVDIPSSLDSEWTLDVKKSSAKIPDDIKDLIRIAVKDSVVRSNRTTRFPGAKEQTVECKVWERINHHEGKVSYSINRDLPCISALNEVLGENERSLFEIVLSQIECYLPKYSIVNDNMDALQIVNTAKDMEEERLIEEAIEIIAMFPEDKKMKKFDELFLMESYRDLFGKKEMIRKRVFGDE